MLGIAFASAAKWFVGAGMGAITAFVAEMMKARQDSSDKAHEIEMMRLQLRYAEKTAALQMADRQAMGALDLAGMQMAYQGPAPTGIPVVDLLNGLMRPLAAAIVLGALGLFSTTLLLAMMHDLFHGTISYRDAIGVFSDSIIGDSIVAILGFLFGARSFKAGRS